MKYIIMVFKSLVGVKALKDRRVSRQGPDWLQ